MKLFHLRYLLFLIPFVVSFLPGRAQKWNLYSAFDNNPVKIIDTPDKTYFLVHQQYYDKSQEGYNFPSLALFEYDKSHPADGISALISRGRMSGADVRLAEYSPAGGFLLVGYQSGIIDLVNPDGSVTAIDALTRSSLPGGSIINSVTFDPVSGDAWVATEAGYLHIDSDGRKAVHKGLIGSPLSWIGRTGDKLLAVSDGSLFECDNLSPHSFSDFKPVPGIAAVMALMPLSDTGFACLSGVPGSDISVIGFHKDGSGWIRSSLGTANFHAIGKDFSITHQYEPNVIRNRDGYLLYSGERVWQIKPGDDVAPKFLSLTLPGVNLPIGSWDMRDFWGYEYRGKFRKYHAEYDTLSAYTPADWTTVGEAIRPNAPASFISTYINYSPAYGQLVVNHGQTYEFINNSVATPALLSGKKGEKWTVYAPLYNIPWSAERNPQLLQTIGTHSSRFPVPDPHGLAVDPQNPDRVACGSLFGGLFIADLSDPKKEIIHFGAPNDYFNPFPGFVSTTPLQTWRTLSLFSNPEFDTEGRMWVFSGNPFEAGGATEPKVSVRFITADQRKAFYEATPENYASLKSWTTIGLPLENCTAWDRQILCGNHPKNRNRVFAFTSGYENTLVILDHHGSPENAGQIDFKIAKQLEDERGWRTTLRYVSSVAEDPSTGDIIIATLDGLYVIAPDAQVKDGIIRGKHLTLCNGSPGDIVPTEAHIFKVIFDDEGRLWIGTRNMGVVGVNRDRTEVIARYNTSNSPIPSDWVTGLGWNPDTRSLVISTDRGLAEVFPDLPSSAVSPSMPVLTMTTVPPDYNGAVEIRNLSTRCNIIIRDREGREIRRLGNGSATTAEWDLRDNGGHPVAPGLYTVNISPYPPLEIIVMR